MAAILTNTMLPDISEEFLTRMMDRQQIGRVNVGARRTRISPI